jgi:hypothetical protein
MNKFFQLIALESGNVTGDFGTEVEMRSFLKDARNRYGSDQILHYGVAEMDETGHIYRAIQNLELLSWIDEQPKAVDPAAD